MNQLSPAQSIMENYKENIKNWWNQAVPINVASDFYDLQGFLDGRSSLQEAELVLLGDISGKSILHLQCHFGQDSISLARLGATVVGVDISEAGIEKARELVKETKQENITFVCSDIYDLPKNLDGKFDIVFTSYGVLSYLPDLDAWAKVICHFVKPGGKFVFVEFHPLVGILDDDFKSVEYRYFQSEPIVDTTTGTYANRKATVHGTVMNWNHGLAEVITSLINNGIQIKKFHEYDYSHYNCFPNVEETEPRNFRFKRFGNKIPMMYSIVGVKCEQ